MNLSLMSLEIAVVLLGLGVLLLDLWTPAQHKRKLGYVAAVIVLGIFVFSFARQFANISEPQLTAAGGYVFDPLALFFKRFFLVAAVFVLIMAAEFSDRIETAISEYYSLILFALAGMMFASSANDFTMLFVSLETITVTFYVLTSFQRGRAQSLEAGVKYLVIGGLSTGFTVMGIALVSGTATTSIAGRSLNGMNFNDLAQFVKYFSPEHQGGFPPLLLAGLVLVLAGIGFKIAAVPFQIWAPDVYQGAPTPTTAFLAIGSKAAGFALLLRLLFTAIPEVALHWEKLMMVLSAVTILYGNLCAIPQRSVKRLLGYSSIAHAGYLLLGIAAMGRSGSAAILYYLSGYLFTVLAAFTVITIALRHTETDDISGLSGLNCRSPFLAWAMTLAMVSLAGIPPLAGFFGKFLLLKAVIEEGANYSAYYWLAGIAIIGVVVSLYYYFGVVRVMFWSRDTTEVTSIPVPIVSRAALLVCMAGILFLGIYPQPLLSVVDRAVQPLVPGVTGVEAAPAQTAVLH
ncbi:MAG TPA: NADH-quinone oxidoreductase subunit N [Candidatus Acidoferrum sp.]|nr:NADH-quinone oxidoreductase subunit N [Candidatus Acidoferrum sp.]